MADIAGVPKPTGLVHPIVTLAVPGVVGFAGFIAGDVFGGYDLMKEYMPAEVEGSLPFSSKIDYTAMMALIPYGIGTAVVYVIAQKFGQGGQWSTMIFRSAKWFLLGIMIHILLAAILPRKVAISGGIAVPAVIR